MIFGCVVIIALSLVGVAFSSTYVLSKGTGLGTGWDVINNVMSFITCGADSLVPSLIVLGVSLFALIVASLYLKSAINRPS